MRLPLKKENIPFLIVPFKLLKEVSTDAAILFAYLLYKSNRYAKFKFVSQRQCAKNLYFSKYRFSKALQELIDNGLVVLSNEPHFKGYIVLKKLLESEEQQNDKDLELTNLPDTIKVNGDNKRINDLLPIEKVIDRIMGKKSS